MSIEHKIGELEQQSFSRLEQPDSVHQSITHQFTLSDEYSVRVESDTRNDQARMVGSVIAFPHMQTSIFIGHRGPLSERRQRNAMAFSCLLEHDTTPRLHGIQYDAPRELPLPVTIAEAISDPHIDIRQHAHMITLSNTERELYIATLAVARMADVRSVNTAKYTTPPVDNEAVIHCSEAEAATYDQWCDAHTYDLTPDISEEDIVRTFLHTAAVVLCGGTIHTSHSITREESLPDTEASSQNMREIYLEANTYNAPEDRLAQRNREPRLKIAITEQGVEHVYELTASGRREVRLHNGDFVEKYRGLNSFEPTYGNDGSLVGFSFSQKELDDIQAMERASGLFEPTSQELDFFLARIGNLRH